MSLPALLAAVLALAVVVAWVRLSWRGWRLPPPQRPRRWRLFALLALQPLAAVLLHLTLLPPAIEADAGEMTVLTAGAPREAWSDAGAGLQVALPEAPAAAVAERVPDLATALRRHPQATALRIVGAGLEPRDRDAARGRALRFEPAPLPEGFVHLAAPRTVAAGDRFTVAGRVHGVAGGEVELLDPAGRRVDLARLDAQGGFRLGGSARAAGPAGFALRLHDDGHVLREELPLPLWTRDEPAPRVLLLAGAASPELKYLRRWIADAGMASSVRMDVGAGAALGERIALDAAGLRGFDLAVVDERAWAGLAPRQRDALIEAVEAGMGLLLRPTGPVPEAVRRQWRGLGFELATAGGAGTFDLPPMPGDAQPEMRRARAGAGTAAAPADAGDPLPALARPGVRLADADAVPLLRDAAGGLLAAWQGRGRGRIGVWLPADSFRLVLAGHGDRHAELWSGAFAALARTRAVPMPRLAPEQPREGQRLVLCGLGEDAGIVAPDGGTGTLLPETREAGVACAAWWPTQAGWHVLRDGAGEWPFHVRGADEAPALAAAESREATLRLAGAGMPADADADVSTIATAPAPRGPSWPWLLAWLATMALLWWLERARPGRGASVPAATEAAIH